MAITRWIWMLWKRRSWKIRSNCSCFAVRTTRSDVSGAREELRRVGEICLRHGVLVVSDEIHSDFTREGHPHTVFAKLGAEFEQNCLICTAPSKTFNLAGLQISNIFCAEPVSFGRNS